MEELATGSRPEMAPAGPSALNRHLSRLGGIVGKCVS